MLLFRTCPARLAAGMSQARRSLLLIQNLHLYGCRCKIFRACFRTLSMQKCIYEYYVVCVCSKSLPRNTNTKSGVFLNIPCISKRPPPDKHAFDRIFWVENYRYDDKTQQCVAVRTVGIKTGDRELKSEPQPRNAVHRGRAVWVCCRKRPVSASRVTRSARHRLGRSFPFVSENNGENNADIK